MRSFTPKIIDSNWSDGTHSQTKENNKTKISSKPTIQSYHLKKITPGFSMNDLDKIYPINKQPNLTTTTLKNTLKNSNIILLDNGDICRHNMGGSAPDFKKIFVTEFI